MKITTEALDFINKKKKDSNSKFVLLYLKKSGCSGYAYQLDYVSELDGDDKIVVDQTLNIYSNKSTTDMIDFNKVEISLIVDVLSKSLNIKSSFEEDECGCGKSFSVKNSNSENNFYNATNK